MTEESNRNQRVSAEDPPFRLDSTGQQAPGLLKQAVGQFEAGEEVQLRSPGFIAEREVERMQVQMETQRGVLDSAEASRRAELLPGGQAVYVLLFSAAGRRSKPAPRSDVKPGIFACLLPGLLAVHLVEACAYHLCPVVHCLFGVIPLRVGLEIAAYARCDALCPIVFFRIKIRIEVLVSTVLGRGGGDLRIVAEKTLGLVVAECWCCSCGLCSGRAGNRQGE